MLARVSEAAGFDVTAPAEDEAAPAVPAPDVLADDVLGRLVEMTADQARQLSALTGSRQPGTAPPMDEVARLREALAQAAVEAEGQKAEIALLHRRLAAAERQAAAVAMQLRKLSQPHVLAARDRLNLAVALDQPQTFHSTEAVTAEVQRLRHEAAEATARMQAREAELLSSTSWRVTAPLRAVSRIMRRGRG